MRQRLILWQVLVAGLIALVGCRGTFEAGVERTPIPDRRAEATITALSTENARLAATLTARATPTPAPLHLGQIAYVQGGDIWTRTLPDGKPIRLTSDGRNREPRWSPTGRWLAFRRERPQTVQRQVPCDIPRLRQELCSEPILVMQNQVWVIEESGQNARLVNPTLSAERFAWSPAFDKLAYVTADGELSTINADGTGGQVLISIGSANSPRGRAGGFAWSPDGQWIAYEWLVQNTGESSTSTGLWKISSDGKTRAQLYRGPSPNQNALILAGWSSLGQNVLFWQDPVSRDTIDGSMNLYRIAADPNSNPERAILVSGEPTWPWADYSAPAPLGTGHGISETIAMVVGTGPYTWSNKRIDIAGHLSPPEFAAISPAWSPDGTRVAFAALPERRDLVEATSPDLAERHIWIADSNGIASPQMLTRNRSYRDEHPLWSTDGKYILFARVDTRGRACLWLVPVESGSAWQVVDELTPAPDPMGTYGYIDWGELYDWWRDEDG